MEIGYSSSESFILNIDIRFHHVREVKRNNNMGLRYCPTGNMIADILTKNLSKTKHLHFIKLMKFI